MANTGIKQAVVVYKVRTADSAPLDVNGELTSISGRKQAIALLNGATNPDVSKYEVEFNFSTGQSIEGTPTLEYSDDCLSGYLIINPDNIVLVGTSQSAQVTITSSSPWELLTTTNLVSVSPNTSAEKTTVVTVSQNTGEGIVELSFSNGALYKTLKVTSVFNVRWILATGFWDDLGFWDDEETWNY